MSFSRVIRWLVGLAGLCLSLVPGSVLACAACFGKSDSSLAKGMNWGIASLLVVVLMHASLIATQLIVRPAVTGGAASLVSILAWAAALWLVVAVIAVATGGQFTRQPLRTQVA